ncbi:OTU domain-containing protein At3g57810 isoform X1 [Amborella trichopoda]|uniref:OTU domain-containing protein At3g57810 isoform X1 n=1 Tax=Amborella trichopoda TaxID=13333 RepID=UPI0005D307C3|nr:OTU domain-containing protein At3g57810 isoform X1 [Amborella trichopoda]|eukprot:XP_011624711.1 OTU domain-containing protein At3g57810 isoform X1 [Amborella trichopoda]
MELNSNNASETLLNQLRSGKARFEIVDQFPHPLVEKPIARISSTLLNCSRFFARIEFPLHGTTQATKKVEHHAIQKVTGDGRCLFRALVKGMAINKGLTLNPSDERDDADELRMAVKEIICTSNNERHLYEEALISITVEQSLKRYCQRIEHSDFWGGESELLVLSKLCCQPIVVYIPEHEHRMGRWGNGFIPIVEYGAEYMKASKGGKPRKVVRLLYTGGSHYDLLI